MNRLKGARLQLLIGEGPLNMAQVDGYLLDEIDQFLVLFNPFDNLELVNKNKILNMKVLNTEEYVNQFRTEEESRLST